MKYKSTKGLARKLIHNSAQCKQLTCATHTHTHIQVTVVGSITRTANQRPYKRTVVAGYTVNVTESLSGFTGDGGVGALGPVNI